MKTALDNIRIADLVILIGTVGAALYLIKMFERWQNIYEGVEKIQKEEKVIYKSLKLSFPKIGIDTRGYTDITKNADTYPTTGFWGGHDMTKVIKDQAPGEMNVLFHRAGKMDPWTKLNKDEVRKRAFNSIYTHRLIH